MVVVSCLQKIALQPRGRLLRAPTASRLVQASSDVCHRMGSGLACVIERVRGSDRLRVLAASQLDDNDVERCA